MTAGTVKKKAARKRKATPRPPARPRVAQHSPPINQPGQLGIFAGKLIAQLVDNPGIYVNPPWLAALQSGNAALSAAVVAAEGGSDAAQTTLLSAAIGMRDTIGQHAAWIQSEANKKTPPDAMNYIITAGLGVAKKGQRTKITSPEVTNGGPGVVHFEVPTIPGALMWFTEVSLDSGKTYARSVDTEHVKGDITGLPSGQTIMVRLRTYVRGNGYMPWTTTTIVVT
jgi:hypothetical protein